MLRYHFSPDRGHHALAWGQADSYHGDNLQKIKGNLAEIAFYEFLRHTLPIEKWHWFNGEYLRRGEQEYCEHDFVVGGNTVDVKGRSRVKDLFDLGSVDSDLVVLVGIPSDLADNVSEADSLLDFARRGTANYDPVVIIGMVNQDDLNPDSYTLHHPAPDGPKMEQLPLQPVDQLPAGISIGNWLEKEEERRRIHEDPDYQIYEGTREFHISVNGKRLLPGSFVKPTSDTFLYNSDDTDSYDFPEKGMVVECPDRPAGATFNPDRMRYEQTESMTHGRTPAVGVIGVSHLNEELLDDVDQLAEEHVNPAIPQLVYDNVDESLVQFTGASTLERIEHIRSDYSDKSPLSDDWWPSEE